MDRIEQIEQRLEKLERLIEGKQNNKESFARNYTVSPDDMPTGYVAYVGKYSSPSGKVGSTFGADKSSIKCSLSHESYEIVNVLSAFASEERIDILKLLMDKSRSARELMDILGFQTTGKLYHHLSFLEKIGAIRKEDDRYSIVGKYISSVILILTAVDKIIRNTEKN